MREGDEIFCYKCMKRVRAKRVKILLLAGEVTIEYRCPYCSSLLGKEETSEK